MMLIEPKTYQGRTRTFVKDPDSVVANDGRVEYTLFEIESSSLQPIDGRTLQAVSDVYRTRARYQFWTETPISTLEQGTNQISDQILIEGEWYGVFSMKDWIRTSFLPHYHCIAVREDQNNTIKQIPGGGNYG